MSELLLGGLEVLVTLVTGEMAIQHYEDGLCLGIFLGGVVGFSRVLGGAGGLVAVATFVGEVYAVAVSALVISAVVAVTSAVATVTITALVSALVISVAVSITAIVLALVVARAIAVISAIVTELPVVTTEVFISASPVAVWT